MHHPLFISAATEAQDLPSPEVLADAPVLRDWAAALEPSGVPCLVGTVTGHSMLEDGRRICTSMLIALDPGGTWARTWSRWYRLDGTLPADIMRDDVRLSLFTWLRHGDAVQLADALRTAILNSCRERLDA